MHRAVIWIEWQYLDDIVMDNKLIDKKEGKKVKRILCYGDSNTHGYNPKNGLRYPEEIRWTGRLAKLLGENYRIIEEGLNSRTTALEPMGEPWRSGAYCLEPCLRSHLPIDLVILMLGSNDLKLEFHQTEQMIGEHIRELVRDIKIITAEKNPEGKASKILMVSPVLVTEDMADGPFGYDFGGYRAVELSKKLAPVYEHIAREEGCGYLNGAKCASPGRLDGLHLEEEGHKKLAEALAVKVWEMFAL